MPFEIMRSLILSHCCIVFKKGQDLNCWWDFCESSFRAFICNQSSCGGYKQIHHLITSCGDDMCFGCTPILDMGIRTDKLNKIQKDLNMRMIPWYWGTGASITDLCKNISSIFEMSIKTQWWNDCCHWGDVTQQHVFSSNVESLQEVLRWMFGILADLVPLH